MPSACSWAGVRVQDTHIYYADILRQSARAQDPFLVLHGTWILRRLSPYCSRVELSQLARSRDEQKLLWGMGRELANIHLGARAVVPRILRDLRPPQAQMAAPGSRDHDQGHVARLESLAKAPAGKKEGAQLLQSGSLKPSAGVGFGTVNKSPIPPSPPR